MRFVCIFVNYLEIKLFSVDGWEMMIHQVMVSGVTLTSIRATAGSEFARVHGLSEGTKYHAQVVDMARSLFSYLASMDIMRWKNQN